MQTIAKCFEMWSGLGRTHGAPLVSLTLTANWNYFSVRASS